MTNREGEVAKQYSRSDRFFCIGNQWYVTTREGSGLGPFSCMGDAQGALILYLRRMHDGELFVEATCI